MGEGVAHPLPSHGVDTWKSPGFYTVGGPIVSSARCADVIAICFFFDRSWSWRIAGDLIAIKSWSRQALVTHHLIWFYSAVVVHHRIADKTTNTARHCLSRLQVCQWSHTFSCHCFWDLAGHAEDIHRITGKFWTSDSDNRCFTCWSILHNANTSLLAHRCICTGDKLMCGRVEPMT